MFFKILRSHLDRTFSLWHKEYSHLLKKAYKWKKECGIKYLKYSVGYSDMEHYIRVEGDLEEYLLNKDKMSKPYYLLCLEDKEIEEFSNTLKKILQQFSDWIVYEYTFTFSDNTDDEIEEIFK